MNIMGRITKKLVVSEVVIDDVPASADSAGSLTSRDASGSEMEMEDTESVVNTARNSSNSDRAAASNSKSGRRRASSKQLDLEVTDNIAKDATKTAKAKNSKRNVTFDGTA